MKATLFPFVAFSILANASVSHGAGDETKAIGPTTAPPKSAWDRETLTDDWLHAGSALREHGVFLTGSLTNYYAGLASGDGDHSFEYGGKGDLFLRLDGQKLGLWKGLGLQTHGELNFGRSPVFAGGTFLPNNLALFVPAANETAADLSLYLSQQFGDSVSLLFGKINTIDLYAAGREFSGGRGVEKFMHTELVAPISGVTPPMIFGGIISAKTKPAKFTLMIYDPASQTRQTGFEDAFAQGVVFNGSAELASQFLGKSGKHIFTAAYSTKESTSYSDPELLLPTTPPASKKEGIWYFGYAFEQTLWRDANDPKKAWGLFGQAGVSDEEVNPLAWSLLGGIGGTSPIPGRERDKFGAGAFYVGYANGLKDGLRLAGVPARNEAGIELFYNVALTPWLLLTGDAQFIRPPRSDRATAVITGVRAQVIF